MLLLSLKAFFRNTVVFQFYDFRLFEIIEMLVARKTIIATNRKHKTNILYLRFQDTFLNTTKTAKKKCNVGRGLPVPILYRIP